MLNVAYIGNFLPPHSTENDVARAFEVKGHQVTRLQESDPWAWRRLENLEDLFDMILWTRTWRPPVDAEQALAPAKLLGIPVVGFHLDRWWGLKREPEIRTEPFFRLCDVLFTADGGHDASWSKVGIEHVWLPPAVDAGEMARGHPRGRFRSEVAFVGNWRNYHAEWPHRTELVQFLQSNFRRRFKAFPENVNRPVRGPDLRDLYASTQVNVGDSCLVGGATRYWSDRIPETLGRFGFLLHPNVVGLEEHFTPGVHLDTWDLGDWDGLRDKINWYLSHPDERERIVTLGQEHVRKHHTYMVRVDQMIDALKARGRLSLRGKSGLRTIRDGEAWVTIEIRPDTADDVVWDEQWVEGVYRLDPDHVRDGVVVDIGANVGSVTLWAVANGASFVHAYEPDADNLEHLRHNLSLNDGFADKVRTYGAAVIHGEGPAVFASGDDPGFESVTGKATRLATGVGQVIHEGGGEEVDSASFPKVIAKAAKAGGGEVALLKIDCEGCEFDLLRDAKDLAKVRYIVIEFHGEAMGHVFEPEGGWSNAFGRMATTLAEWGHVEILGRPSLGGMIYGERYE